MATCFFCSSTTLQFLPPPPPVKVGELFIYLRRIVFDETGETIGGTIDFIVEEYFKDQEGPGFL